MKLLLFLLLILLIPNSYGIAFGLSPNKVIMKNNWTLYHGRIILFNPSNLTLKLNAIYDKSKLKVALPKIIKPNSKDYINYSIISKTPFASSLKLSLEFNTIRLTQSVEFKIGEIKPKKSNYYLGILVIISIVLIGTLIYKLIRII
jgi:hypothetical protein